MEVASMRSLVSPCCCPAIELRPSTSSSPPPHPPVRSLVHRGSFGQRLGCSTQGFVVPSVRKQVKQLQILCMANPRRVKMVAQQLKREISDMLLKDTHLQEAMMPERKLGVDLSVSSIASVTDVMLSNDLQVAKVYVAVYGDRDGIDHALKGLKEKQWYVRAGIAKRMALRITPDIRFIPDDALERGTEVLAILDSLKKEREALEKGKKVPSFEIPEDYDDFALRSGEQTGDTTEAEASKNWDQEDDWETSPEEVWDDEETAVFGLGKEEEDRDTSRSEEDALKKTRWGQDLPPAEVADFADLSFSGGVMTVADVMDYDNAIAKRKTSDMRRSKKTAKRKSRKK